MIPLGRAEAIALLGFATQTYGVVTSVSPDVDDKRRAMRSVMIFLVGSALTISALSKTTLPLIGAGIGIGGALALQAKYKKGGVADTGRGGCGCR